MSKFKKVGGRDREKRTIGKERGKEEGGGKRKGRKERRTGGRQAS